MNKFMKIIMKGMMIGGILEIVEVGMKIILGIVKVVNLDNGELMMEGMLVKWMIKKKMGINNYEEVIIVMNEMLIMGEMKKRIIIKKIMDYDEGNEKILEKVGM